MTSSASCIRQSTEQLKTSFGGKKTIEKDSIITVDRQTKN